MRSTRFWLVAGLVAAGAACGKDATNPNGHPDGPGSSGGGSDGSVVNPDADTADGWVTLVERGWSITAGSLDVYECHRMQVTQDMWISAYHSVAPHGTHHEVLTIDTNDTNTGDYDCTAGTGTFGGELLYAAGVGTPDFTFPAGVAVHVAAGTWINLNLHLFDATDNDLSGTSGVQVKTVDPASVQNPADMTFSGTFTISVPAENPPQPVNAAGGCTTSTDWHVFALWPHMHQIATHQSLVYQPPNGSPTTLLDTDYDFSNQKTYPMTSVTIPKGSQITTTCTYLNNTAVTAPPGHTIAFGESSTDEMCFTGLYKYPAGGTTFACVSQ